MTTIFLVRHLCEYNCTYISTEFIRISKRIYICKLSFAATWTSQTGQVASLGKPIDRQALEFSINKIKTKNAAGTILITLFKPLCLVTLNCRWQLEPFRVSSNRRTDRAAVVKKNTIFLRNTLFYSRYSRLWLFGYGFVDDRLLVRLASLCRCILLADIWIRLSSFVALVVV